MASFSFNKTEKLKSRKSIEALFRSGRSFSSPPFRMLYKTVDDLPVPVQMTVAVPKRYIRKAVERNLIKRRTREAYRIQKQGLVNAAAKKGNNLEVLFLYQSTEISDYATIRKSIKILLLRLEQVLK